MYVLKITTRFKKDLKKVKKDPKNDALAREVLKILKEKGASGIPKTMKPHRLKGNTVKTGSVTFSPIY